MTEDVAQLGECSPGVQEVLVTLWLHGEFEASLTPVRIHVKVVMTGFYLSSLTSHLKCLPLATWEPVKCDC